MISKKLKFQLAYFCNGSSITASPETIMKIMSSPYVLRLGLIPSPIQELDPVSMRPVPRLAMQSPVSGMAINFLSNRVDVFQQVGAGAGSAADIGEFVKEADKLLSSVAEDFKLKGNRLALIAEYIIEPTDKEGVDRVRDRLITKKLSPISEDAFEWNYRVANRGAIGFGSDEVVNQVTSLNKVLMQIPSGSGLISVDGIVLSIDINTLPELTDTRFDHGNCGDFYKAALGAHDAILELVKEAIRD